MTDKGPRVASDISSSECPVSAATEKSQSLLRILDRSNYLEVPLFGPDLSQWPIWATDAAMVLRNCRNDYDSLLRGV